MKPWRFYGRGKELKELVRLLQLSPQDGRDLHFAAYYVMGRRNVGKTQVFREAVRVSETRLPTLRFEFRKGQGAAGSLAYFRRKLHAKGLGALVEGLPPRGPYDTDTARLADMVDHLIRKGAVVSLDEFHHADRIAGFLGDIKQVIDEFQGVNGTRATGKLLLTGSHQQRMAHMLSETAPLFGRVEPALVLKQWPVSETLEMAAEQGFLARPARFLSLWTAYGGVPRHWQEFAGNRKGQMDRFLGTKGDREWRAGFIEDERLRLRVQEERYDWKAYMSVEPGLHRTLRMLAESPQRGMTARAVAEGFRDEGKRAADEDGRMQLEDDGGTPVGETEVDLVGDRMRMMQHLLELVSDSLDFLDFTVPERWKVHDLNTRFQLHVFPEVFSGKRASVEARRSRMGPGFVPDRLELLEGLAFERFCAEWTEARLGAVWSEDGAARCGLPDVDVLAEIPGGAKAATLFMGSCKRNPDRHDPVAAKKVFNGFLDSLKRNPEGGWERKKADDILGMERRRAAFSPVMTGRARKRMQADGFACFDIRSMARELGIDPGNETALPANPP